MLYSFFWHQKAIKNRQALHEVIRASSLSIIFVEFSFKPVNLTMVMKIFKFMENYNSWKMYLQVKILNLEIFTYILQPLPPIPPISPAVRSLLQVLSSPLRWPWLGILSYLYFMWFVIFQMWRIYSFANKTFII